MIPTAENLQQAVAHFLNNNGQISCDIKSKSKICKTLKEANEFFSKKVKKVRNKVRPIK